MNPRQTSQEQFVARARAAIVAGVKVISRIEESPRPGTVVETSKAYWRDWLLVKPMFCPQKEMLANVSRPSKIKYVIESLLGLL